MLIDTTRRMRCKSGPASYRGPAPSAKFPKKALWLPIGFYAFVQDLSQGAGSRHHNGFTQRECALLREHFHTLMSFQTSVVFESRHAKNDLASVTLASYRGVLNGIWRPKVDEELVHRIRYSMLVKVADDHSIRRPARSITSSHSPTTLLTTYTAWTRGRRRRDVEGEILIWRWICHCESGAAA